MGRSTLGCLSIALTHRLDRPEPDRPDDPELWPVEWAPRARQPAALRAPTTQNGGENDQWLDREVELPITRMIKVRKRSIAPESIRLIHSGGDRRGFLVRTARWA